MTFYWDIQYVGYCGKYILVMVFFHVQGFTIKCVSHGCFQHGCVSVEQRVLQLSRLDTPSAVWGAWGSLRSPDSITPTTLCLCSSRCQCLRHFKCISRPTPKGHTVKIISEVNCIGQMKLISVFRDVNSFQFYSSIISSFLFMFSFYRNEFWLMEC